LAARGVHARPAAGPGHRAAALLLNGALSSDA
jgi:hypothetical protein